MASRYVETPVVDYCYNPIHVVDSDKDIIVPCGKCDGCLLHKANQWSMRCGMEIEDTPVTIFGSLTYSNKYLPKLVQFQSASLKTLGNVRSDGYRDLILDYKVSWYSDNPLNIRFNGVRDVPRCDGIIIDRNYASIDVVNWDNRNYPVINYASKRDIQLWLKLIRKDLDDYGIYKDKRVLERGYFRYFIISEVGPTTFRSHFHFLIFCQSQEVASYLLECSLYKNWQMCSEDRFVPYCHICDSGARGYVTQYLTSFSNLPKVFRENKEIRPFRLASKSPGIGFVGQDKAQIFKDVERGIIKYSRPIRRLESNSILEYPKDFTTTLFPKCYRFNKISDSRRFFIYSYLYRSIRESGQSRLLLSSGFSKIFQASDYLAMCACERFCREYVNSPLYYYYLLDTYYYKVEMEHLKSFYQAQQNEDFVLRPLKLFEYYPNVEQICLGRICDISSIAWFKDFGIDVDSLVGNKSYFEFVKSQIKFYNTNYRNEVSDILTNMVKVAKFNELTGNAPTNV